jgi:hypothetical protein
VVSLAGFAIGELIIAVIASYVLVVLLAIAELVRSQMDETFEQEKWRIFVQYGALLGGVAVIMWTDVRIGTVMFINGAVATLLVVKVVNVWGSVRATLKE